MGAGKIRDDEPQEFEAAHTVSWAAEYHFLPITVDGKKMRVRALSALDGDGNLVDIKRKLPGGGTVTDSIEI